MTLGPPLREDSQYIGPSRCQSFVPGQEYGVHDLRNHAPALLQPETSKQVSPQICKGARQGPNGAARERVDRDERPFGQMLRSPDEAVATAWKCWMSYSRAATPFSTAARSSSRPSAESARTSGADRIAPPTVGVAWSPS